MKSRVIFFICFLAAFAAGACAGMLWRESRADTRTPERNHWLSELNLSGEQEEAIKNIWTESMKNANWQQQREKREAAQKDRDAAVQALLSDEQKAKFAEIGAAYKKRIDEMSEESRKAKDEAVEKTKAVLTNEQRVKYDEMRKKRHAGRGRGRDGAKDGAEQGKTPDGSAKKDEKEK